MGRGHPPAAEKMRGYGAIIVRVLLLLLFTGFVVGFAASQYDMVRGLLTVICSSCIGIG